MKPHRHISSLRRCLKLIIYQISCDYKKTLITTIQKRTITDHYRATFSLVNLKSNGTVSTEIDKLLSDFDNYQSTINNFTHGFLTGYCKHYLSLRPQS